MNSRVCHFNAEISGKCTLCNITGPKPVPLETFAHIFFKCPCVSRSIEDVRRKYLPNLILTKENFFLCNISIFEEQNVAVNIFFDIIRYLIWQSKLEKKLPIAHLLESNLLYMLKIIVGSNNKVQNYFTNCPFFQNTVDKLRERYRTAPEPVNSTGRHADSMSESPKEMEEDGGTSVGRRWTTPA